MPGWLSWALNLLPAEMNGILGFVFGSSVLGAILPNSVVEKVGFVGGKIITTFFRQKIGVNWETPEKWIQGTIAALMSGFHRGLDFDD